MGQDDRIQAARTMLEEAGVSGFNDADVARIAAGAAAAAQVVERCRHYCRFDSVPGVFHRVLQRHADQEGDA